MTFCFLKYIFITLLGGRKPLKHDCLWVVISITGILKCFLLYLFFLLFHNTAIVLQKIKEKSNHIPPDFRRFLNAIT